uniref:Retrotransposon gag domain-containing protein n=1 Tax=Chromera velia CCMP2878 TaxID=1169474 RepID=A0A0G4HFA9_9ALVE|eukprot:Cvel_6641.t1-p1 / transcript=Cvel_6641.t1 / gene=Cvel_6641 / organism=Chromera_velia_CCMP2878 / gene_product=hypothetical protein / transcript_product=hypothetical protein / location=Cvel_scaffold329:55515-57092(-) / protein_length=318 / sequence_SO=supercontig / SO=protein_coding / is_pseudo=false
MEQNYIEDLEEKQGIVVNTLNDLFVALRKKFTNPKKQEILRKELYAVKFSPSKGIETYSDDFLHAAAQLTEKTTVELLFHYKKSLPAKIQQEVVEGEDLDTPYAVTTVRAVDEVQAPQPRMIRFQGILEGTLVRVLLESRTHKLFISSDFCHTWRFLVRPLKHLRGCKRAVKEDGKEAFCQVTECTAPLKLSIQGYKEEMKFTLAELDNEYDTFLSMKWLEAHNPQIDWKEKSVTFPHRGQLLTLWGTGGEDPYGGFVPPPISAKGAERAIRGGAMVHIFRLAPRPLPSDPCIFSEEQCLFPEEQQETDFDELEERLI